MLKVGDLVKVKLNLEVSPEYEGVDTSKFIYEEAVVIGVNPNYDDFNYSLQFLDHYVDEYQRESDSDMWDIENLEEIDYV